MKFFTTIIAFCILFNTFSQIPIQLGTDISPGVNEQNSIQVYSNNLGTPFVAYIKNYELHVLKYIGGVWQNTTTAMDPVDIDVRDFDIQHNKVTDETILVYTKGDGLYLRKYSGTWSAASVLSLSTAGWGSTCLLSIDETNNVAYFIFEEWTGLIVPVFATYDLVNNTFGSFNAEPNSSSAMQIISSDLQFDQLNGNLYLSTYYLNNPIFSSFDGLAWSDVESSFPYTILSRFRMGITTSTPSNIVLAEMYNSGAGNHYRLTMYNSLTNAQTILEPMINLGSNPYELTDITVSPINNYAAFSMTDAFGGSSSILKYYDGNTINTINHGLGQEFIEDCEYDAFGNLLLATIENGVLKVYKIDAFTIGVEGLTEPLYLEVYPNPASDNLHLTSDDIFNAEISINTISGQLVYSTIIKTKTDAILNIQTFEKGIYILHCKLTNGEQIQKYFIKE